MKIIGFGHRKRVGKDTAVKFAMSYLTQNTKLRCCRCSFGDQVKIIAEQMFAWGGLKDGIYYENHPHLKDALIPEIAKSAREIWIDLGHMGRSIHRKVWLNMAIHGLSKTMDVVFLPDLRDPVETDFVESMDGWNVRIDRAAAPHSDDPVDSALKNYTGWRKVLDNNGTMRDFNMQIVRLMEEILDV